MCCSKGLLRRFVPFLATFALGLLIANLFASAAVPNFNYGRETRQRQPHSCWRMENRRLKEENFRLRQQAADDNIRQNTEFSGDINELVPPPPPLPPVAPRAVR